MDEQRYVLDPDSYDSYDSYDSIESGSDFSSSTLSGGFRDELQYILKSSGPLVITFFLQYLVSAVSIYAAGKLGPKELAAASLAICTFNISGLAVYQGMATSLDSFCSQAYGSGKLENVGLYCQRCALMMATFTLFPLGFIWWYSGSILKHLVADGELVEQTQRFMRVLMMGAPGLFLFECGKRFLQAQNIYNASTAVLLILAPVSYVLNWVLVWHPRYGLGFLGAPVALSLTYWLSALLLYCYVLLIDGKKCWNGFDLRGAMKNWIPMLKLALPGVVMVEAEYLAFEVLTIFAASFGTAALAAQSIASNVGTLAFQLPFAVSVAITTRIGHFVGMNDVHGAKQIVRISILLALITSLLNFSTMFFGRRWLGSLFTSSHKVLKVSNVILIFSSINQLWDCTNVLQAGVLRGQGRQSTGSMLNLLSYYAIALPFGYYLAFSRGLELHGLWYGLMSGVFFLAVSESYCVYRSNWHEIITESTKRQDK